MNPKQIRKVLITNLLLWGGAIILPIVAPAFSSKAPKIFELLMPMFQVMLALASTWMFNEILKSASSSPPSDVEIK